MYPGVSLKLMKESFNFFMRLGEMFAVSFDLAKRREQQKKEFTYEFRTAQFSV